MSPSASDIKEILIHDFQLGLDSIHGPSHWRRVEAYGKYLAAKNGGDQELVTWFAYFHDCCRVTELNDPGHGLRGARKALIFKDQLGLDEEAFETLFQACAGHTDLVFSHDPTIAACWDADRLDLDRVGSEPEPSFLSTEEGKRLALMPAILRRMEVGA